jgi:Mlc titration factor MtfA (ptsG expression regulator)
MLLLTGIRRKRLRDAPFPQDRLRVLERCVPLYRRLPAADREELRGHLQVFLAEKHFEGGGGFPMTDEARIVVAAQACLLLLHRETDYFPGLSSIVVYPDEFVVPFSEMDETGVVSEGEDVRSGESWQQGTLVLSWRDVQLSGTPGYEDYNVVLHEFAHQLDDEEGITSGVPLLGRRPRLRWDGVLADEFARLQADDAAGRRTLLDPYGADSPAEFFAVATECFFAMPAGLKSEHPELYAELARYFRQDPAAWPGVKDEG